MTQLFIVRTDSLRGLHIKNKRVFCDFSRVLAGPFSAPRSIAFFAAVHHMKSPVSIRKDRAPCYHILVPVAMTHACCSVLLDACIEHYRHNDVPTGQQRTAGPCSSQYSVPVVYRSWRGPAPRPASSAAVPRQMRCFPRQVTASRARLARTATEASRCIQEDRPPRAFAI